MKSLCCEERGDRDVENTLGTDVTSSSIHDVQDGRVATNITEIFCWAELLG